MRELTPRKLRLLNVGAGLLQLLTGCAIFGLGPYESSTKLPWYSFFIASWDREDNAVGFYQPVPKQAVSFPIAVWSGAFLLLSAIDHLLVVLPGINRIYNAYLCENKNPFRWAEYAVSASIMSVMIAQLSGVTDIHLLFSIAALMASTMLFGWQMEVLNGTRLPTWELAADGRTPPTCVGSTPSAFLAETGVASTALGGPLAEKSGLRVDWGPFIMGCWPFLAVTLVTACYFFQAVVNGDPPGFVWSLFFILFFLYCLFAVNQVLQFKQVRGWRGFARAEFFYIILSLTSKQLLAWITYGGTMRFKD